MAPLDQYLFYNFNRLCAEFFANADGATWRVHMGRPLKDVDLNVQIADCLEPTDPAYEVFATDEVILIDHDDGTVSIVIENVLFDFGDGPAATVKCNWLWVTFEATGIEERYVGALQLPAPVDIDDVTTSLLLDVELPFGALDPEEVITA